MFSYKSPHPNPDPRPQLEDVYGEIYRVLKPGALFASYEWVATAVFDPANVEHVRVMDEINYGNGLPVRCARVQTFKSFPAHASLTAQMCHDDGAQTLRTASCIAAICRHTEV